MPIIQQSQKDGSLVYQVKRDLVLKNIDEIREQFVGCLEKKQDFVLDLSSVQNCDTPGVQLLFSLSLSMNAQGRTLKLAGDYACVKKAFSRLGLTTKLFEKQEREPA